MASKNPSGKGGFKDHPENRNNKGQRNSEAVAFSRGIRAALVEEGKRRSAKVRGKSRFQSMIVAVWDLAEEGEQWAVSYISERVEGKVKDEIDHNIKGQLDVFNHDAITGLLAGRSSRDRSKPSSDQGS